MYNRASADPDGKPWSERKKLVWWQAEGEDEHKSGGVQSTGEQHGDATTQRHPKGKWVGYDVPDFPKEKAPDTPADPHGRGMAAHSGAEPFIMMADGVGRLFVAEGLVDGPLPAHYEPLESPVKNPLYKQQSNPMDKHDQTMGNMLAPLLSQEYPYVVTTYRLTEHHTSGAMSRWIPWLSELQPELFAEIDPQLAREKGLQTGDWATLTTARGELEMRVLVTGRVAPLEINGQRLHQIGLPYHWSFKGIVTGDTVNNMTALTEEPNVHIHEAKTFTGNLRKGRKKAAVASEPVSGDAVVVQSGGEAAELNDKVHLGVVDVTEHPNNIAVSVDAGQSPAAETASGKAAGSVQ
jgi:formate dehydrogenase major subunit